jgi:hypothetical protein
MNATQSRPVGATSRITPSIAVGGAAVSVAMIAILAFTGSAGQGRGNGAIVVPAPSASPSLAAPTPAATPGPTAEPTAEPSVAPTRAPLPTTKPSNGGTDAMPITVALINATGADVHVDIADQTGDLVGAASGKPGEGASVEPYTLHVENLDPKTLKLTWVDFPIDSALELYIEKVDGAYRLLLVQPEPTGATDAIAFDRELVLSFAEPIAASQVEAFLEGGLDTPG